MTADSEPVPPEQEPHSRAMVVFAHPDDADWGCSGTVAKWTRLGWEVVYVMCTDGSKGTEDRSLSATELSRIRKDEQTEAGRVLGLKSIEFLDFPDGYLEPTIALRREIVRVIRKHRPHILITTNPTRDLSHSNYIGHPDHFAAGEAALSAVFPSARDHLWDESLLDAGSRLLESPRSMGHDVRRRRQFSLEPPRRTRHRKSHRCHQIPRQPTRRTRKCPQMDATMAIRTRQKQPTPHSPKASNDSNSSPDSIPTTRKTKTKQRTPTRAFEPAITNSCQAIPNQNLLLTISHQHRKATVPDRHARVKTSLTPSPSKTKT